MRRIAGSTIYRAAVGLLILVAVAHVATLVPRVASLAGELAAAPWLIIAAFALTAVTAVAACALASLLLWKAPDRAEARALVLFLSFLAIFWGSMFRFLDVETGANAVKFNVSYGGDFASQSALGAFLLALAAFLRFSALFPQPLTPDRLPPSRLPRVLRRVRFVFLRPAVVWGAAIGVYLAQRLLPEAVGSLAGTPDAGADGVPAAYAASFLVAIALLGGFGLSAIALGARNLRDSYRMATPEERGRILWMVTGFSTAWWMLMAGLGLVVLATFGRFTLGLLGAALPVVLVLAPLVAVLGAAVGILYSGAIDPGLALERSTVYGILGAGGVVAFAALENVLSEALEGLVGLPGYVGAMLAGGLVTLALIPVRRAIRRRLHREDRSPASRSSG